MRPNQSMRIAAVLLAVLFVLALAATAGARSITGHGGERPPRRDAAQRRDPRARRDATCCSVGGGSRLPPRRPRPGHASTEGREPIWSSRHTTEAATSVRCGAGTDVVNADLVDAVARDCELVGRRLSRDPYRQRRRSTSTRSSPTASRSAERRSPTFQVGRRFEGGATNVGFAVTTDDGPTWRSGLLPGLTTASRPAWAERARQRPGRRVRRGPLRRGSSRRSRSEGPTTRLAINRSTDGFGLERGVERAEERRRRRRGHRVRQELARLRQLGVVALLRPLLPRLHALAPTRDMLAVAGRTTVG